MSQDVTKLAVAGLIGILSCLSMVLHVIFLGRIWTVSSEYVPNHPLLMDAPLMSVRLLIGL